LLEADEEVGRVTAAAPAALSAALEHFVHDLAHETVYKLMDDAMAKGDPTPKLVMASHKAVKAAVMGVERFDFLVDIDEFASSGESGDESSDDSEMSDT
jgi:hypothetical protein